MKSEIKKGAILSYIVLGIYAIVGFIYTPFLIKCLGNNEYGLYSLVNTIIGYLTILDLGLSSTIIIYTSKFKSLNKEDTLKKLEGMFLLIYIIIGFICSIIGLVLYLNFSRIFGRTLSITEIAKGKQLLLILIINTAISFPFSIYSSIIIAYERFVFSKITAIIRSACVPLIMYPLLLKGYKSLTLVLVITFVNLFIIICNYLYCKFKLKVNIKYQGYDKLVLKEIFTYTIFIFLNVVVDKINWGVDQLILGVVSGTGAVSIYALASQFNVMFIDLSTSMNDLLLPKITKKVSIGKDTNDYFIKLSRIQFLILFLMVSGFILFGKTFIGYWTNSSFSNSYYIAVILMTSGIIPLTQNSGITILRAKNKHKKIAIIYFLIAILNVLISIPLAKVLGGIGCSIGTAISIIFGYIIIDLYYYQNGIAIKEYYINFIDLLIRELIPVVFMIFILQHIIINSVVVLLLLMCLYVVMYIGYNLFFVLNDYEKSVIKF